MWAETMDNNREKEREKEKRQREGERQRDRDRERESIKCLNIERTTKAFIINYPATLCPQDIEISLIILHF